MGGPTADTPYRRYRCATCGTEYDEALGWPDEGIPAGTRWESIPADWICPVCGTSKAFYERVD